MIDAIKVLVALLAVAALVFTSYSTTQKHTDSNNRLAEATEAYAQQSKEFTQASDRLADALERKECKP